MHASFKRVFDTKDGKKVLEFLKDYSFYDDSMGNLFGIRPEVMAQNEGRRNVVSFIMQITSLTKNQVSEYVHDRLKLIEDSKQEPTN